MAPQVGALLTRPNLALAVERYGAMVNGGWPNEVMWCAVLPIPYVIGANWINTATGKPTDRIYCNRDIMGPLLGALGNVLARGLLRELKTFDGCYQIRSKRGLPDQISTHSYALAIDINAAENPLGGPNRLSPELVACFTDMGFAWGGRFNRADPQHFQWAAW